MTARNRRATSGMLPAAVMMPRAAHLQDGEQGVVLAADDGESALRPADHVRGVVPVPAGALEVHRSA